MKKIFLCILVAFVAVVAQADENMPSLKVGAVAPDFTAPDTLGVKHKLSDYKGQYLVLDFWASWCGDCRRENPDLKDLYEEFKEETINGTKIEWLSVSFDHEKNAWKNCLRKEQFPWTQVSNLTNWKKNPIAKKWDLHWIPTFFVVDPEGKIAGSAITAEGLKNELCRLIGIKLLPAPATKRGTDIMTTLKNRKTDRDYEDREVSEQDLSDLLWAAGGVNREDGKLTSPTAMNRQEITLYAIDSKGAYLYDPAKNTLKLVAEGDHRDIVAGFQKNFAESPLFILMVCDFDKFGSKNEHAQQMVCVDAGIVSENISVFCAAVGMKTCARATMDKKALQELLGLNENQVPMMNNSIGY